MKQGSVFLAGELDGNPDRIIPLCEFAVVIGNVVFVENDIGHARIEFIVPENGGDRLYLHAAKLEITLPGGKRTTFAAPLPQEFNNVF